MPDEPTNDEESVASGDSPEASSTEERHEGDPESPRDLLGDTDFELTAIDASMPDPIDSEDGDLPPIPGKRYFTIGEVAQLCRVKPHVLRYWEQEFEQLNPAKRRGNRRYYQQQDVILIRQIRGLLNDRGFTISGAKLELSSDDAKQDQTQYRLIVKQMIAELEDLLRELRPP